MKVKTLITVIIIPTVAFSLITFGWESLVVEDDPLLRMPWYTTESGR